MANQPMSDSDFRRKKQLSELEHRRKMQDNQDKREDQIRTMAWFALWGMLLYPILILVTSYFNIDTAATIIGEIAPTYFVAIAGLVAAFFGAHAYTRRRLDEHLEDNDESSEEKED